MARLTTPTVSTANLYWCPYLVVWGIRQTHVITCEHPLGRVRMTFPVSHRNRTLPSSLRILYIVIRPKEEAC